MKKNDAGKRIFGTTCLTLITIGIVLIAAFGITIFILFFEYKPEMKKYYEHKETKLIHEYNYKDIRINNKFYVNNSLVIARLFKKDKDEKYSVLIAAFGTKNIHNYVILSRILVKEKSGSSLFEKNDKTKNSFEELLGSDAYVAYINVIEDGLDITFDKNRSIIIEIDVSVVANKIKKSGTIVYQYDPVIKREIIKMKDTFLGV